MKDRVVVITGASNGIGREIAFKFAAQGARLALTYCTDRQGGQKTVKRCVALGASETFNVRLDLRNSRSISGTVDKVLKTFGRMDILINNAGTAAWKPFSRQSLADIENQVRTNLEGLIKMTWICLPHVKDMIINIGSGVGRTAYPDLVPYCATKFGVRGFTQALAMEITSPKIYAVNPDMTRTRMTGYQGRPAEQVAEVVLNTAMGRYGKPSGSDVDVWDYDE